MDDCASALLAIFYYDFRHSGSSRSLALQQAQQKLRHLSGEQLKTDHYQQLDAHLQQQFLHVHALAQSAQQQRDSAKPGTPEAQTWNQQLQKYQQVVQKIQAQRIHILPAYCQEPFPFANPFCWAGFISQGLA